ncbi:hypothetical protein Aperf_G00000080865 [Anoplocephala perfoliata]
MAIPSRLIITDPPKANECAKDPADSIAEFDANDQAKSGDNFVNSADNAAVNTHSEDKDLIPKMVDLPEYTPTSNFQQEQLMLDTQIMCGTCKQILERRGNESYCNLLKDHYLECFLDKEGDHVKCVKLKAALEPGQMYWCKSCILIFEKPWSLFQHMADKAKGAKVQRWEKKVHLDWIDSVAGLMAGHDLGLFSLMKLRTDLRNLLTDQHSMEEEMEAAAIAAAAMVQWLAPISNPWRLHQREMMRKIENLHRQMLRRAGGAAVLARAAFANGSSSAPFIPPSPGTGGRITARTFRGVPLQQQQQLFDSAGDHPNSTSQRLFYREVDEPGQTGDEATVDDNLNEKTFDCSLEKDINQNATASKIISDDAECHAAGASGDHPYAHHQDGSEGLQPSFGKQFNSNNTNNTPIIPCPRGNIGSGGRSSFSVPTRSFRSAVTSLNRNKSFSSGYRQLNRPGTQSFSQFFRHVTSPAKFDMNCGFTDDEVEELLCQGIKPWDSEASAALAVLHGEMDHLLK